MLSWHIFTRFFALGLISFGGPAAHIGYFRRTFVDEQGWVDAKQYASFVALSQFMPGPGSSQIGFAIGYQRGGLAGAIAAFVGFTLPSFILMYLLAVTSAQWLGNAHFQGVIHGLKLLAVVVVADAVWNMFNQFCQKKSARLLMLLSASLILCVPSLLTQVAILVVAAIWGMMSLRQSDTALHPAPLALNYAWLAAFLCLFGLSILSMSFGGLSQLAGEFFRVGSLVFGGGHVVLPLLQANVGDALSPERFLSGYALAQAVPGPMFTLATFLGAELWIENPPLGALVATLAIFLPGFLLMLVTLSSWDAICQRPKFAAAIAGVNAAVVGLLLAALFQPVFVSAVTHPWDMALVLLGFGALKLFKTNILVLVLLFSAIGVMLAVI